LMFVPVRFSSPTQRISDTTCDRAGGKDDNNGC
jgi:hypothetical protein